MGGRAEAGERERGKRKRETYFSERRAKDNEVGASGSTKGQGGREEERERREGEREERRKEGGCASPCMPLIWDTVYEDGQR